MSRFRKVFLFWLTTGAVVDAISCYSYKHLTDLSFVGTGVMRQIECPEDTESCLMMKGTYILPNHPVPNYTKPFYDGGCGSRPQDRLYDSRFNPDPRAGPFLNRITCSGFPRAQQCSKGSNASMSLVNDSNVTLDADGNDVNAIKKKPKFEYAEGGGRLMTIELELIRYPERFYPPARQTSRTQTYCVFKALNNTCEEVEVLVKNASNGSNGTYGAAELCTPKYNGITTLKLIEQTTTPPPMMTMSSTATTVTGGSMGTPRALDYDLDGNLVKDVPDSIETARERNLGGVGVAEVESTRESYSVPRMILEEDVSNIIPLETDQMRSIVLPEESVFVTNQAGNVIGYISLNHVFKADEVRITSEDIRRAKESGSGGDDAADVSSISGNPFIGTRSNITEEVLRILRSGRVRPEQLANLVETSDISLFQNQDLLEALTRHFRNSASPALRAHAQKWLMGKPRVLGEFSGKSYNSLEYSRLTSVVDYEGETVPERAVQYEKTMSGITKRGQPAIQQETGWNPKSEYKTQVDSYADLGVAEIHTLFTEAHPYTIDQLDLAERRRMEQEAARTRKEVTTREAKKKGSVDFRSPSGVITALYVILKSRVTSWIRLLGARLGIINSETPQQETLGNAIELNWESSATRGNYAAQAKANAPGESNSVTNVSIESNTIRENAIQPAQESSVEVIAEVRNRTRGGLSSGSLPASSNTEFAEYKEENTMLDKRGQKKRNEGERREEDGDPLPIDGKETATDVDPLPIEARGGAETGELQKGQKKGTRNLKNLYLPTIDELQKAAQGPVGPVLSATGNDKTADIIVQNVDYPPPTGANLNNVYNNGKPPLTPEMYYNYTTDLYDPEFAEDIMCSVVSNETFLYNVPMDTMCGDGFVIPISAIDGPRTDVYMFNISRRIVRYPYTRSLEDLIRNNELAKISGIPAEEQDLVESYKCNNPKRTIPLCVENQDLWEPMDCEVDFEVFVCFTDNCNYTVRRFATPIMTLIMFLFYLTGSIT